MAAINAGLMIILAGATLLHEPQHLTTIPTDIIKERIKECLDEVDLPTTTSKRPRRHSNGDGSGSENKRTKVDYDRERAYQCVMSDWLGPVTIFPDRQFE